MTEAYKYDAAEDRYVLPDGTAVAAKTLSDMLRNMQWSDENVVSGIRTIADANRKLAMTKPALSIGNNNIAYQYDGADRSLLESFPSPMQKSMGQGHVDITVPEFTSLCPMTGQPDFANIKISYEPNERCVESRSIKLYLGSYRQHGEFHEACVQRIANDLIRLLDPEWLSVTGEFTPRGGIPFWPKVDYIRPTHALEFKKAPEVSLEGMNTFRMSTKWAERLGDIDAEEYEIYYPTTVRLVFKGKLVGQATINEAMVGRYDNMLRKHAVSNYEPNELLKSMERAYGHIEDGDLVTVLWLKDVIMLGDG